MITNESVQEALDKIILDVMTLKSLLRGNPQGIRVVENGNQQLQVLATPATPTPPATPVIISTPPAVAAAAANPAPAPAAPVVKRATAPVPAADPVVGEGSELDSFDKLREALNSPKWPDAVNKNLVCDPSSERDKVERGRGILELMIEEDLNELKVLDAGCGEGHCAFLAHEFGTKLSVGYDIKSYPTWDKFFVGKDKGLQEKVMFTQDFDRVIANAPYDVVMVFDVIDHIEKEDPATFLTKVAKQLAPSGKLYLRLHPWTSRHGTHLYHDLNKAFVHLVFTEEELRQLIPYSKYEEPSIKVCTPINTYENIIKQSGLKIVRRREIQEKVEPFFKIPKIAERIQRTTKFDKFPEYQLGMQFIDYILQKA
jgi:2-polyprenyl-3-methyl-5-hydroxy-6-metoxy-1,4-benzoquinol methylase